MLCLKNDWTSCFAHLTCTIRIEIRIRTFLEPNIPPVREIFEKNRDNITIYGNNSDSVGCLGKKTIFVLFVFKCVFHSLFAWTWMIHFERWSRSISIEGSARKIELSLVNFVRSVGGKSVLYCLKMSNVLVKTHGNTASSLHGERM